MAESYMQTIENRLEIMKSHLTKAQLELETVQHKLNALERGHFDSEAPPDQNCPNKTKTAKDATPVKEESEPEEIPTTPKQKSRLDVARTRSPSPDSPRVVRPPPLPIVNGGNLDFLPGKSRPTQGYNDGKTSHASKRVSFEEQADTSDMEDCYMQTTENSIVDRNDRIVNAPQPGKKAVTPLVPSIMKKSSTDRARVAEVKSPLEHMAMCGYTCNKDCRSRQCTYLASQPDYIHLPPSGNAVYGRENAKPVAEITKRHLTKIKSKLEIVKQKLNALNRGHFDVEVRPDQNCPKKTKTAEDATPATKESAPEEIPTTPKQKSRPDVVRTRSPSPNSSRVLRPPPLPIVNGGSHASKKVFFEEQANTSEMANCYIQTTENNTVDRNDRIAEVNTPPPGKKAAIPLVPSIMKESRSDRTRVAEVKSPLEHVAMCGYTCNKDCRSCECTYPAKHPNYVPLPTSETAISEKENAKPVVEIMKRYLTKKQLEFEIAKHELNTLNINLEAWREQNCHKKEEGPGEATPGESTPATEESEPEETPEVFRPRSPSPDSSQHEDPEPFHFPDVIDGADFFPGKPRLSPRYHEIEKNRKSKRRSVMEQEDSQYNLKATSSVELVFPP